MQTKRVHSVCLYIESLVNMQSLQMHLRRVLWHRLRAFPAINLQVWTHLSALLHTDIANQVALCAFALPVAHPVLDAWIAQIHRLWRQHFVVRECYDGVQFLPQREALLKRPVLAVFQHRHVSLQPTIINCETRLDMTVHSLSIRFYGNVRDVERMKQRSWNVLTTSMAFRPMWRYGSILQVMSRTPTQYWRSCNSLATLCLSYGPQCPGWVDYPHYEWTDDAEYMKAGLL